MPDYRCTNKKCNRFNLVEHESKCHIVYHKEGRKDYTAPCPECGEDREMMWNGLARNVHGRPNVSRK